MSKEVKVSNQEVVIEKKRGRGRPKGSTSKKSVKVSVKSVTEEVMFDPSSISTEFGKDLDFDSSIFEPLKIGQEELDTIISTDGGLMPATNMILVGGPGSGKTTITLDMLSRLTTKGKRCLFVSGEMDRIGYFKMCKRLPTFQNVEVLFLKDHSENVDKVLEYVFNLGYDVVAIDSIAEVIEMYKDLYKCTKTGAESWLIDLQDKTKLGGNKEGKYTSFINIQQVTKDGSFVGSNRLKHMMDAMAHIEVDAERTKRTLHFSKNRDCDKNFKVCFSFFKDEVFYSYELIA